jgi:hypothetical protein
MDEPQYFDVDGKPCTLDALCIREPAWAASRHRSMLAKIKELEGKLDEHVKTAGHYASMWREAGMERDELRRKLASALEDAEKWKQLAIDNHNDAAEAESRLDEERAECIDANQRCNRATLRYADALVETEKVRSVVRHLLFHYDAVMHPDLHKRLLALVGEYGHADAEESVQTPVVEIQPSNPPDIYDGNRTLCGRCGKPVSLGHTCELPGSVQNYWSE